MFFIYFFRFWGLLLGSVWVLYAAVVVLSVIENGAFGKWRVLLCLKCYGKVTTFKVFACNYVILKSTRLTVTIWLLPSHCFILLHRLLVASVQNVTGNESVAKIEEGNHCGYFFYDCEGNFKFTKLVLHIFMGNLT